MSIEISIRLALRKQGFLLPVFQILYSEEKYRHLIWLNVINPISSLLIGHRFTDVVIMIP